MTSSRLASLAPRPLVLVAVALASAGQATGCLFSETLPDGAAVTCDVDADCPREYSCSETLKLCLPPSVNDAEPPALVDATVDRGVGGVGATFRFTFEVSEPLGALPVARVVADGVERPLALVQGGVDKATVEYVMTYTANGTEPQGAFVVEVSLVDTAGNESAGLTLGTIAFDFTPPVVSDEVEATPRFIRAEGPASIVTFTVDAPIQDALASVVMRRDGESGPEEVAWDALDPGGGDGLTWSFSHVADDEAEGEWAVFAVSLADLAGNPADEVPLGTVVVDNTPPAVLLGESSVSPPLLALQGFVQAQIAFSEPLAATPIVLANNGGGTSVPLIEDSRFENTIQYGARADAQGTFTVTMVLGAEDLAGNRLVGDVVIGTYVVDDDPPGLLSLETNGATFRGQDTLIVDLTADETLVAPPLVDVGGVPLVLVPDAVTPPAYRYELPLAGTGLEGDTRLSVRMTDLVGKQGVDDDTIVRVDSRAPELVAALVSPTVAPSGASAVLTITLDEALGSVGGEETFPVPTFDTLPGTGFAPARRVGTTYIFTLPIDDLVASRTYELVRIDVTDEAGNSRVIDVGNVSFTVDSQPPVLTSAVLNSPRYSAKAPADELVLTLQTDVPAAQVNASLLDRKLACVDDVLGFVICRYTVDGTEVEGASTILVELVDDAGNTTFGTLPVELDFTPPSLLLLDLSPTPARAGARAFISLGVNEPLGEAPSVQLDATPPLTAPVFTEVTTFASTTLVFVFEHFVQAGEDGTYTLRDVTLVDRVGNSSAGGGGQVFLIDTEAPSIEDAVTTTTNAASPAARQDDVVTVEVTLSEAPDRSPVVLLGGTQMALDAASTGPLRFVYTHVVSDADQEGPQTITLTTSDPAGNFAVALLPGATFDFTPPAVDGPVRVELRAPPNVSMAKSPTALTTGSRLGVSFEITEDLGAPAEVSLGALPLAVVSAASARLVEAELVLPGGAAQGANDVVTELVDEVGNAASIVLDAVTVDTTRPASPDVGPAGVLVHQRVPFGGDQGTATLAPVNRVRLAPNATLPANHSLVVFSTADPGRQPLAIIDTAGAGTFTPAEVLTADLPALFVTLVDGAGNIDASVPRKVRRAEWVASMRGKVAGSTEFNPNRYDVRRRFGTALSEALAPEVDASDGIDVADGNSLLTAGGGEWRQVRFVDPPSPRERHAMAFDEARGVTILFGGCTDLDGCLNDETWIHDGETWILSKREDPERDGEPSGRAGHAMAYSVGRGTVVLFGGQVEFGVSNETWEWTGESWRRLIPPASPPARADHGIAQTGDGRIVLFGGRAGAEFLGDTWLFDGNSWIETTGVNPPARAAHAMGLDRSRGNVALFGGDDGVKILGDTWLFDEEQLRWLLVSDNGPFDPAPRMNATLVHGRIGPLGDGLVLFGGKDNSSIIDDVRVFTDAWVAAPLPVEPEPRAGHAAVFQKGPDELFLFGGETAGGLSDESWSLQDEWVPRDPPGTLAPPARDSSACAVVDKKLVVVGGRGSGTTILGDVWQWDGLTWREQLIVEAVVPPARERASFAGAGVRGVLFGGADNGVLLGDTWVLTGSSWDELTPSNSPTPRVGAAMFHVDGRFFLFGGSTGTNSDETYSLDADLEWRLLDTPIAPPPSATAVAATEPGQPAAIAFVDGQTWRFDGEQWKEVIVDDPEGDGSPGARVGAALVSDEETGVLWLIGGIANGSRLAEVWSWHPTTTSWRRHDPVDLIGDGSLDARDRLCGGTIEADVYVFGGSTSALERSDETWAFNPGRTTPPAHVMSVSVASLQRENVSLQGMRVTAAAAGDSPAGAGLVLWAFGNGWTQLATGLGGPQQLTATAPSASAFIVGETLGVAVSPIGGNEDGQATIEVDALEVTLDLTLP